MPNHPPHSNPEIQSLQPSHSPSQESFNSAVPNGSWSDPSSTRAASPSQPKTSNSSSFLREHRHCRSPGASRLQSIYHNTGRHRRPGASPPSLAIKSHSILPLNQLSPRSRKRPAPFCCHHGDNQSLLPDEPSSKRSPNQFTHSPSGINAQLLSPLQSLPTLKTALDQSEAQPRSPPQDQTLPDEAPAESLAQYSPHPDDSRPPSPFLQLETRSITEAQLITEVQSIYAGLVMVEKKCIEIDGEQLASGNILTYEQWEALINLHRTFLYENYDFFLASQHPSSTDRLRKLASKYAMPARMWKHGIYSFLELLRQRLPQSLDHMLYYIYTSYSIMTLLLESVPTFANTWIECLGDLARYRMAIGEVDHQDREIWAGVASYWYNKAVDASPTIGRLYHHLAILARPNPLQQLFFYTKSLTCVEPFPNTQESILSFLNPLLESSLTRHHQNPFVTSFVKAHGILFKKLSVLSFLQYALEFTNSLSQIGRSSDNWREQGIYIISNNFSGILNYGEPGPVFRAISESLQIPDLLRVSSARESYTRDIRTSDHKLPTSYSVTFCSYASDPLPPIADYALYLTSYTLSFIFGQIGDKSMLPSIHFSLAHIWSLALVPAAMRYIEVEIPWLALVAFLNTFNRQGVSESRITSENFPMTEGGGTRYHLPEDFMLRGQIWSTLYYPEGFFEKNSILDDEERLLELPSIAVPRAERCLWLACRLASPFATQLGGISKFAGVFKSAADLLGQHNGPF
ncbi:hypothetical protein FQN57_004080 [Myotisia sp. PD_48]|nr:hypothetical protein FQN57_004080 [Myotisia sp. PD_48]